MATAVATTDPATGTVLVTVEQTIIRDLFTRVVASGWGNATSGGTWTVSGTAANFSVTGTRGQIALTPVNTAHRTQIGTGWADTDQTMTLIPGVVALGGNIEMGLISRRDSGTNTEYQAMVAFGLLGVATLILRRNLAGTLTTLASVTLPFTYTNTSQVRIRFMTCGQNLMAKAWLSTTSQPAAWNATAVDGSITSLAINKQVGTRATLMSTNTNPLPVNVQFDDYAVSYGQPLHMYRITPDNVSTEVRGSPFFTDEATAAADTATAVIWDGEAPFETNIQYHVYTDCGTFAFGSNVVNLDDGGTGWLRDPQDPTRNLRISLEGDYDDCVDQDIIVFSGFGDREYESASGIFDVIDARRPITISQTRKNYGSSLTLTSFSLDDVDLLEDILQDGQILLLSLPVIYGFGHRTYGSDYVTFFDAQAGVPGVDQRVTARGWLVPFRLSDAPPDADEDQTGGNGIGGGGATYDELAASALGTTYTNLQLSGETFFQVASGVGY